MDGDTVIDVKFQSTASLATAKGYALKKGTNSIVLKVKSQTGYTTSYTISVNAKKAATLYINTGSTVTIKNGDVNGDGKSTVSDMANIRLHLLKKYTLKDNASKAADVNNDGKITVSDMANIRLHLL